jgi:prolyl 4-hydroxylase
VETLVNFSPELSGWIQHNLARGCTTQDVVAAMTAQKFDSAVAAGLVAAVAQALARGAPPPADQVLLDLPDAEYVYEPQRLPPGHVLHAFDRDVPVLMRLQRPVIAVLEAVLSTEECDEVIAMARSRLRPSTIVDPETGADKIVEHRDSEGMFFGLQETPFIARLDQRISELMNCPIENGEGLQVLRYGSKAQATPHFDFLVPSHEANKASLARSGQRVSTMVVYLNDAPAGGETVFPELGLAVTPKKGNAVYFEYANSLRQVDLRSVHAGAPVTGGEKWALTKWMRERRFVSA